MSRRFTFLVCRRRRQPSSSTGVSAGVGIDTASIDPGEDTGFAAHQVLGAANIFNLENLTAVADLPARGFTVMALPMKIAGGTGGPARVVARID